MATFEEFRSTFPSGSNEKGESFEVFLCEWLFKNHPSLNSQFKRVWRFSDWPGAWSQKDIGTDLIAEDYHGRICAIQAKFYREQSTIPKADIDSFLSDTNRAVIDYRLLVATTDGIGANALVTMRGQEKAVQSFTLKDFLEPFDWPESLDALDKYSPRKPHNPRPHQLKAIEDVTSKIQSRGQLIMACGTGKTLTGQRIAEKLESKTTLVLLPSLLLLSKTVKDWVSERETDFIFLPVCSDKSVTKKTDEIAVSGSELCFRSTTDVLEIAQFLKRTENKVIFSTYQSSPQIAETFRQHELKPFDLIIADEAHRCAGKVSSDYSTVLDEYLLPAERRLFMTATPRIYKGHVRKKAKDNDIDIASMDDESIFGPLLHQLTFGQAIENDPPLLTDYRVVVVGVNSESVKEMVETRSLVKTEDGLEGDARSLAIQVGLAKAIRDYDLQRVITFHSRIKQAQNFAKSFTDFHENLKENERPTGKITYQHVSSEMSTSERSNKLRALGALENEDRYLLANARCLSEGVDVPSLDGVAFVDPKRSEVDIIQAVGRALRRSYDKEIGIIVIPVFLSESDEADKVLKSSEFDQVWKVVNALRSHDETLGEELDELRVSLGRKKKINLKCDRIIFDIPKVISDDFLEAFETKIVETSTESWRFWFGLLQTFKEQYGHCSVKSAEEFYGHKLGNWVVHQRRRRNELSAERKGLLDALDFVWSPRDENWSTGVDELKLYKSRYKNLLIPKEYTNNGFNLYQWITYQRRHKDKLSQENIEQLDYLGFLWDPLEEQWEQHFAALKAYKQEYGDCLPSQRLRYGGVKLGSWVSNQRSRRVEGLLIAYRIERLNSIGFVWDAVDYKWQEGFSVLKNYRSVNGDCNVPANEVFGDYRLGEWVRNQRSRRAKKGLPDEKQQLLDGLDFIWDPLHAKWQKNYAALKDYKERYGHCNVPIGHKLKDYNLGQWVFTQRRAKDEMLPQRKQQLDDLGFVWDPLSEKWEEGFATLKVYKEQHGHCRVPKNHNLNDYNLGQWVLMQRKAKDEMLPERKQQLDDLGFVWDPFSEKWEEGFTALKAYKEQHGHCRVPTNHKLNDYNLGTWISMQRQTKDRMSLERKQRLDDLGFVWDARQTSSV